MVGHALTLELEPGRYLAAESAVLLAEVRAVKNAGANRFVLVDAGFNELMRPAMYGAFHAMSLISTGSAEGGLKPRSSRARCASRATCSRRARAARC